MIILIVRYKKILYKNFFFVFCPSDKWGLEPGPGSGKQENCALVINRIRRTGLAGLSCYSCGRGVQ